MKKWFLWAILVAGLAAIAAGVFTWGVMEQQKEYGQDTGTYILERLGLKQPKYEYLTAQQLSQVLGERHGINGLTLKYAFDVDSFDPQGLDPSSMQYVLISYETPNLLSAKIAVRADRQSPLTWYYYTFDKRTSQSMRLLALEDLFDAQYDYMGELEREVLDALYRSYEKGVRYYVGTTGEIQLSSLRFDRRFTIQDDCFIFAFAPYEISPDGQWHEVSVRMEGMKAFLSADGLALFS